MPVNPRKIKSQASFGSLAKWKYIRMVKRHRKNDNPTQYVRSMGHAHNIYKRPRWISFEVDPAIIHLHPALILGKQERNTEDKSDRDKRPVGLNLSPLSLRQILINTLTPALT